MLAHKIPYQKFSYADYIEWSDKERWEIIDGIAYNMSPSPGMRHQEISFRLSGIFYRLLKNSRCRAFTAPFDVIFIEDSDLKDNAFEADNVEYHNIQLTRLKNHSVEYSGIKTVVQPDIVVVCDPDKLQQRGCFGSPDIVVEILSKATAYKDETEKLRLYEKHAVKEYWIINPDAEYIMRYLFDKDSSKYAKPEYLIKEDILESIAVKGLAVDLMELWA